MTVETPYERRYGEVLITGTTPVRDDDGEPTGEMKDFEIRRPIRDGGKKTYRVNWPNCEDPDEAAELAQNILHNIRWSEKIWEKQHNKGRTPGASSRPNRHRARI